MEETERGVATTSNDINKDDKYKRLKKRYSMLLQQHLKIHLEYRQTNEQLNEMRAKKQYMYHKLAEILKRMGYEAE
jgi:hypothetical protein